RDIDDLIPARARIFKDVANVLKHGAALGLDIVGHDPAVLIKLDAWNVFAAALTRSHAGKKKQVTYPPGMRIKPYWLRSSRRVQLMHPKRSSHLYPPILPLPQ